MEGNTTSRPRPNELVIPDDEAYLRTDIELSDIAEYLMTNLEPIDIKTLDAEDHICPICHEEFQESDNMKLAHEPVKSVCNHIFGKRCVIKWLDPFFYFGSTGPVGRSSHGKTDCQSCRRISSQRRLSKVWSFWPRGFGSGTTRMPMLGSHGPRSRNGRGDIFENWSGIVDRSMNSTCLASSSTGFLGGLNGCCWIMRSNSRLRPSAPFRRI